MRAKLDELFPRENVTLPPAATYGGDLSSAILQGTQAMQRGDVRAAVEHQTRARDLCLEVEQHRERALMELLLAGYLAAAGEPARAAETYRGISIFAEKHAHADLAAQAELGLAALCLREHRREEALAAYLRAATLGEKAAMRLYAIEALRLAGLLHAELGNTDAAIGLWSRAIRIAEQLPRLEARASSAAEAARCAAATCVKLGLVEQGRAFQEKSRALEGG
jgi:tetratricopeptide (TPR) repeat protein